jgi:glycosyltransferase involved in cell wall biosynthesis
MNVTVNKISCIVPVFNESDQITDFIEKLIIELLKIHSIIEILIVNDGSTDDTANKILKFKSNKNIKYIEFSRNFGKEAAITAGLEISSGDCVYIIDADFQHPFFLLSQMYSKFLDGIDNVYCYQVTRNHEQIFLKFAKLIFYKLFDSDGVYIPPGAGDFRLMGRCVVDSIVELKERNRYMKGIYAWVGYQSYGIPYSPDLRQHGFTKFNFNSLLRLAINGITGFSVRPLYIIAIFGLAISLLSIIYALFIILNTYIFGAEVNGWPSLIVSIMLFAGINIFSLGVVGVYVGNIYNEIKGRPVYLIRKEASFNINK